MQKYKVSLTIFLVYILPIILIVHSGVDFGWRFIFLGAIWLLAFFHSRFRHENMHLGIRIDNLKGALISNLSASAIAIIFLLIMSHFFRSEIFYRRVIENASFFAFYMAISSPFQEFIYRGVLFAKLKKITKSPLVQILISASLFSFLHLIYGSVVLLVLSFLGGVLWGWIYHRFPNVAGVALSHAIIGAAAMYLQLI